jgi:hypothetical protein
MPSKKSGPQSMQTAQAGISPANEIVNPGLLDRMPAN